MPGEHLGEGPGAAGAEGGAEEGARVPVHRPDDGRAGLLAQRRAVSEPAQAPQVHLQAVLQQQVRLLWSRPVTASSYS